MKRLLMVVLLSALVAGCQDQRPVTAPPDATSVPGGILAAISDGTHAGGNPDFFFLPPLQPPPQRNPNFDRGRFNPNLRPVVKICDGRNLTPANECVVPLRKNGQPVVFTAVRGWDGLPDWVDPEQYHALWQTRNYDLVPGHPYRVLVKVGSTLLGFLDIVPADRLLGALRITAGGQDVGWLDDWVVPIRFRIEQGALCASHTNQAGCTASTIVGAAPGTAGDTAVAVVLPSGYAGVSVPPGAIGAGDVVTIVIEKQVPPYEGECLPTGYGLEQSQGCYHFRTEPALYQFLTPVRMEACVDPGELDPESLVLYKYNTEQGLVQLPWADPQLISCSGFVALNADGTNVPASFANAVWRGAGRWLANLLGPRELSAAPMFGTPKGLGGLGGSFSDVGGAVAQEEGLLPDLTIPTEPTIVPDPAIWGDPFSATVTVWNGGQANAVASRVAFLLWCTSCEWIYPDTIYANVPALPIGSHTTIAIEIPRCTYYNGYYAIKAVADVDGVVDESDDDNNESPLKSFQIVYGSGGSGACNAP
jgi:hypothetical protein